MKYKPEPVGRPETETPKTQWDVEFPDEDGGMLFNTQESALIFCLLLEIRDILEDMKEG